MPRHYFFLVFILFLLFSCSEKKETSRQEKKNIPVTQQQILLVYTEGVNQKNVNIAKEHLAKAFNLEIVTEKAPVLPQELKSTIHTGRYRADSILAYMRRTFAGRALKTIMLTHHDISTTKYSNFATRTIKAPEYRYKDWAIFGLGSCPGYCCVVSINRLHARKASEEKFVQRMKNILVHEVGHTFGLPHCPSPKCVMNDANETILTVDRSTGLFCNACKIKQGWGFEQ